MTVQELESIKNNLYDKLSLLKEEYNTSVKQFIDEYPIQKGDLVNIHNGGDFKGKGIFDGFTFSRYEVFPSLKPIVKKIKKDGTASVNEVFLFYSDVVTKAESDSN